MTRRITIDPVTRIEGHAQILLDLDDAGKVADANLVVNELRGFERILVGMQVDRTPLVTARICGVCPSAHHMAAVKALDNLAGVRPPPAGEMLREVLYLGHQIHSHALALYALTGPDLVFGLDGDPKKKNIVGVVEAAPELATKALRIRSLGQKINELVGGRGIHPITAVAGGISFKLTPEKRDTLRRWADEALATTLAVADDTKALLFGFLERHPQILQNLVEPTWYVGTVKEDGTHSFYDGKLRVMDETGTIRYEVPSTEYYKYVVEKPVRHSYMKPAYWRADDGDHAYRVSMLARLNVIDQFGTPIADSELAKFRQAYGRPCHTAVLQLYAKFIELIHACERAQVLLANEAITGPTRVPVKFGEGRGIGHVEAPRGVLVHDYEVDRRGIVRKANLMVATQQNYAAINTSLAQAASSLQGVSDETMLGGVEFALRCYDPCLSCATHALGQMPIELVFRHEGEVVRTVRRNG